MNKITLRVKMSLVLAAVVVALGVFYVSCSSPPTALTPSTDSTSASEIAEGIVSGTVNSTFATGTLADARFKQRRETFIAKLKNQMQILPEALAQVVTTGPCPTPQAGGTNCAVSGNSMTLGYSSCNYTGESATNIWSGAQILQETTGSTTMSCGAFPSFTAGNVVQRIFSNPTTHITGTLITLLDTSGSVNGTPPVTATGISTTFTGAVSRNIVINGIHIAGDVGGFVVWNWVLTSGTISVNASNSATGVVTLQDLLKGNGRTATANLAGLSYTAGCCFPTGGTVTTSFSDGTPAETLAFTATCGQGTLNAQPVTLNHCW